MENRSNNEKKVLDVGNAAYTSAIKISIGALDWVVPLLGSTINTILFEVPSHVQQKRLDNFVIELENKLKKVDQSKIDKNYLKSEDFYDITRIVFEISLKIKTDQKRKQLASVYLETIKKKSSSDEGTDIVFISFVGALSALQITILRFIEENEQNLIEVSTYKNFLAKFQEIHGMIEIDKYEFKYYCNDLENKSLVSFGAGLEDFESTSAMIELEEHVEPSAKLTNFGKQFLEYLKEDAI